MPGQYDPFSVAMDCQSQTFPKKPDDMVLQSHLAGPSTSLSSPQSVQHLPVSSQTAQPLSTTCTPSASLELPPTSPFQTSSSPLTLPLSTSQAESSVAPLLIPAPKASQVAQPMPAQQQYSQYPSLLPLSRNNH